MANVTFIDRNDKGSIDYELCEEATYPESLAVVCWVLVSNHRRVIAKKTQVKVITEDARHITRVEFTVLE